MILVLRLIFRVDFEIRPEYIANFSDLFSLFYDEKKDFWTTYSVGGNFALNGERIRPNGLCRLNVEPVSANGLIEWTAGLPLNKVFDDDEFRVVNRYIDEMFKKSKTSRLQRCGCRLQVISSKGFATTEEQFIGNPLRSSVVSSLDSISDVGITIEGESDDKVLYRVVIGPAKPKNLNASFSRPLRGEELEALSSQALYMDIDLYENSMSIAGRSYAKWASTKFEKAANLIGAFEQKLRG